MSDSRIKMTYEPDVASANAAADAAAKAIESSINKTSPNINVNVNDQKIKEVEAAIDKMYERLQMLPNVSKAASNSITSNFEKLGNAMNKVEKGLLSGNKFDTMSNNFLNYTNDIISKAEQKLEGTKIPGPEVKIDNVDTSGAESNMIDSFDKIAGLAALAFILRFSKDILNNILKVGGDIQDLQFNLQGMFGLEEGQEAMATFRQLAKELPGDMNDAISGFTNLRNRGIYPTKEAFKDLVKFSISQGKDINNLSLALSMAQTENYIRLRAYGVTIQKDGNKLIASFRGQRTELERNGTAVVDYIASLGKIPDIANTANLKMNSLRGTQEKINESLNNMKFFVYQKLEESLIPVALKFLDVVEATESWIMVNSDLAADILELVTIITGVITAAIGFAAVMKAIALVSSPVLLTIIALSFALWDLYNGITEGESIILDFIDTLMFWHDSNQEILDDLVIIDGEIRSVSETVEAEMSGRIVPSWNGGWFSMLMTALGVLNQMSSSSVIVSGGVADTFIKNIPKGGGGFAGLARAAGATFDKIAMAAINLINFLIDKFNALNQKIADAFSGIPFIGDFIQVQANHSARVTNTYKSGLEYLANSVGGRILNRDYEDAKARDAARRNTEQQLANLTPGSINSILNQTDQASYIPLNTDKNGNPTMIKETVRPYGYETIPGTNTPTSNQLKWDRWNYYVSDMVGRANSPTVPLFDPFSSVPGGLTGNDNKGGGGRGGRDGNKGRTAKDKKDLDDVDKKDLDAVDRATIVAIKGIQDVLTAMGYSLDSEIKRADLFKAQKEAIENLYSPINKSGVVGAYYTAREALTQNKIANTYDSSNFEFNIFIESENGNTRAANGELPINSNTDFKSMMRLASNLKGGR